MSKFKITNHSELRKRTSIDVSKPVLTDQSYKKSCDINNIMANYAKTGVLSHQTQKVAQYLDNTKIMSLMDAHEAIRTAKEMFYELPSQIRKLMDNNPVNLESFIKNPENHEMLVKHGVLVQTEVKGASSSQSEKSTPAEQDAELKKSE